MEKKISIRDPEGLKHCEHIKDKMAALKEGTHLLKVRDKDLRGPRLYRRKYRLDVTDMAIHWSPHKDPSSSGFCSSVAGEDKYELKDINEVRDGFKTDIFQKISNNSRLGTKMREITQDVAFSLIFDEECNQPPVDLVAPNQETRDAWVAAISHFITILKSLSSQKEFEMYLKKKFRAADTNSSGNLSFNETRDLCKLLNVKLSKEVLHGYFNEANTTKSKHGVKESLDEDEFVTFYYSLMQRPEVDKLFVSYKDLRMTG